MNLMQWFKLFQKSCKQCDYFIEDFHLKEYYEGFTMMRDLVIKGELTFFAGSCPLDELEKHLAVEDLYTIEHYFKCECRKYFYTGYCVRGKPILKVMNTIPKNLTKTISGHFGKYFENGNNN